MLLLYIWGKKKVKVSRNPKQENVMSGVPQGSVIGTSTV